MLRCSFVLMLIFVIAQRTRAHDGPHPHTHSAAEETAFAIPNRVSIEVEAEFRVVTSNGIPDHEPGQFPNRGNPHTIAAQEYRFRMPAQPIVAKMPTPLRHNLFGVAVNGVVFDPGTAEYWQNDRRSGLNYEALSGQINLGIDHSLAHVQPSGAYHYHGIPKGLLETLGGDAEQMRLVGWAADGFPIYSQRAHADASDAASPLRVMKSSYRLKPGTRPDGPRGKYDGTFTTDYEYEAGLGDLDDCNGRTGVTPEFPQGTYYYVLTEEFPHIPRQFRGTPDASFEKGPPGGGPGGPGGPGPRGNGPPGRPPFPPPPGRRPPPNGF